MPIETTSGDLSFSGTTSTKESQRMHGILEWAIRAGKKIIIFTEALVLISLFSKFTIIRNVNAVNDRIEGLKYAVIEKNSIEQEYNKITADLSKINEIENSRIDWDSRILKITSIIPKDMTLKTTNYSQDSISVEGDVLSVQGFAFFIQAILSDDQVSNIVLKSSNYDRETKGYSFSIVIGVNK